MLRTTAEFRPPLRQRRRLIVAALIWFCGWLIATAPARIFVGAVHKAIPALQLDSVEGSLWQGSARQAFAQIGGRTLALGRVDWRFNGWSALVLHPVLHVSTAWGDQTLDARLRVNPLGTLSLSDTHAVFPVALLQVWAPLPARGSIVADLQSATLTRAAVQRVEGTVDWRGAQWQWGERWLSLGDYRATFSSPVAYAVNAEIKGGGDLAGSGNFMLRFAERNYQVDAKITASRALPQEFRNSLVFLLGANKLEQSSVEAGAPELFRIQKKGSW